MVTVRPVVRRGKRREARLRQPGGIKVGRRGRVILIQDGVRVTDRDVILAAVGRKV